MIGAVRDEGKPPDRALQANVPPPEAMREGNAAIMIFGTTRILGTLVERAHAHSLVQNAVGIDVGHAKLGFTIETNAFDHQIAEFVDHALSVPGQIGRTLAIAAGRIRIGAYPACGTGPAEQMPFVGFSDGDITRRQVQDDRRASEGRPNTGRLRRPEILTYLQTQDHSGQIFGRKQQVGAKGGLVSTDLYRETAAGVAPRIPALLVIFTVIGKVALGNDAQQFAISDYERAIVKAPVVAQRGSHDEYRRKVCRCLDDRHDRFLDRIQEARLNDEIVERIG